MDNTILVATAHDLREAGGAANVRFSEEERRKLMTTLLERTAVPAPPAAPETPKRRWWPFGQGRG